MGWTAIWPHDGSSVWLGAWWTVWASDDSSGERLVGVTLTQGQAVSAAVALDVFALRDDGLEHGFLLSVRFGVVGVIPATGLVGAERRTFDVAEFTFADRTGLHWMFLQSGLMRIVLLHATPPMENTCLGTAHRLGSHVYDGVPARGYGSPRETLQTPCGLNCFQARVRMFWCCGKSVI